MNHLLTRGTSFLLQLCLATAINSALAAPPPNDIFTNSIRLEGTNVLSSGTLLEATRESGEPAHKTVSIFTMTGETVWWSWAAPFAGHVHISHGSIHDHQLAVYTGTRIDQLERVYLTSLSDFKAEQGVVYHIAFERVANRTGDLNLQLILTPFGTNMPNDDFADAAESGVSAVNLMAAREVAEPQHRPGGPNKSLWWRFRVPQNCQASARDLYGILPEVTIAAYTGSTLDTLTLVAKSHKTNGLFFTATGGETYYIAAETAEALNGNIQIICVAGAPDRRIVSVNNNLTFNPSFEILNNGSPRTGWDIQGSTVGYVHTGVGIVEAADGGNFIEIQASATISQSMPTQIGTPYRVKLAARAMTSGAQVIISFGEQTAPPINVLQNNKWEWPECVLTASTNNTTLTIQAIGTMRIDKITAVPMNAPPQLVRAPESRAVFEGATATFVAGAIGTEPLYRQWLFNGAPLPNQNMPTLQIGNVTQEQVGQYQFLVTNQFGSITSSPVQLIVETPTSPAIILHPKSHSVIEGEYVCLGVAAIGTAPLTYQWFRNSQLMSSETNRNLIISQFSPSNTGDYKVAVSTHNESVTSLPATLTLAPTNFGGGQIYFANRQYQAGVTNFAPVFDVDEITLLSGDTFLAQLYVGTSNQPLRAVGMPQPFLSGFQAGYISPSLITIQNIAPGIALQAQMRAWESNRGGSYEEAKAWGGRVGTSSILSVTTAGFPDSSPTDGLLLGLESFNVHDGLPEYRRGRLQLLETKDDGALIWELLGQAGVAYLIERQTDGANWLPFLTLTNLTGRVQFEDGGTNISAIYRSQVLP